MLNGAGTPTRLLTAGLLNLLLKDLGVVATLVRGVGLFGVNRLVKKVGGAGGGGRVVLGLGGKVTRNATAGEGAEVVDVDVVGVDSPSISCLEFSLCWPVLLLSALLAGSTAIASTRSSTFPEPKIER